MPRGTLMKSGGAVILAGATLVVFLMERRRDPPPGPAPAPQPAEAIARLDAGIDTVLSRFGMGPGAVKKRVIELPGGLFTRTERRAEVPDSVALVSVNAALNAMAGLHGARAVASEEPKFRTVTVHIELGGTVVHTIVLGQARSESRGGRPGRIAT